MADAYDPAFPTDSLSASPNHVESTSPAPVESRCADDKISAGKSPTPLLTSAAAKIEKLIHISSDEESPRKDKDRRKEVKEPVRRSRRSRSGRRNDRDEDLTSPERETTRGRRKSSRFSSKKEEVIEIKDEKETAEPWRKRTRFSNKDDSKKDSSSDTKSSNEGTVTSATKKEELAAKKTPFATKVKFEWKIGVKKTLISNPMRKMKDDSDEEEVPTDVAINGENKTEAQPQPDGSMEEDIGQQSENIEGDKQPPKVDHKIGAVGFPLMKMETRGRDESEEGVDPGEQRSSVSASPLSLVPRKLMRGTKCDGKGSDDVEGSPKMVPAPPVEEEKLDVKQEDSKGDGETPKANDRAEIPMDLSRDDGKDSREPGVIIHPTDVHREGRSGRSRRSRPRESDYRLSLEELHVRILQEKRAKEGHSSDPTGKDDRASRLAPKKKWRNFVRQGVLSDPQPLAEDRSTRASRRRSAPEMIVTQEKEAPEEADSDLGKVQAEERLMDVPATGESQPDSTHPSRIEPLKGESCMESHETSLPEHGPRESPKGPAKADEKTLHLLEKGGVRGSSAEGRKEGSREPSVDVEGKDKSKEHKKRRSLSEGREDMEKYDRKRSSSIDVGDSKGANRDEGSRGSSSGRKKHRGGSQDREDSNHSRRHQSRGRSKDKSQEDSKKRGSSTDKERRKSSKKSSRGRSSSRESSHDGKRWHSSERHEKGSGGKRDGSVEKEERKSSKKGVRSRSRESSHGHDGKERKEKTVSENRDVASDDERKKSSRKSRARSSSLESLPNRDGSNDKRNKKSSEKRRLTSVSREGPCDHEVNNGSKGRKEKDSSENQDISLDGEKEETSRKGRSRSSSRESSLNRDEKRKGKKRKGGERRDSSVDEEKKKSSRRSREKSQSRDSSHDRHKKHASSKERDKSSERSGKRSRSVDVEKSSKTGRDRSMSRDRSHNHRRNRASSGEKRDMSLDLDISHETSSGKDTSVDKGNKSSKTKRGRSTSRESSSDRHRKRGHTKATKGNDRDSSGEASRQRSSSREDSRARSQLSTSPREEEVKVHDQMKSGLEGKTSTQSKEQEMSRESPHDQDRDDKMREKSTERGDSGVDEPSGRSRRKRRKHGTSKEVRKHREKSPKRRRSSSSKERDSDGGKKHHGKKHKEKGRRSDRKSSKSERRKSKDDRTKAKPEADLEEASSNDELQDDESRVDDGPQEKLEDMNSVEGDTKKSTEEKKAAEEEDQNIGDRERAEGKEDAGTGIKENNISKQDKDLREGDKMFLDVPGDSLEESHQAHQIREENSPEETVGSSKGVIGEVVSLAEGNQSRDEPVTREDSLKNSDVSVKDSLNEELFMDIFGDAELVAKEAVPKNIAETMENKAPVTVVDAEKVEDSKPSFLKSFSSSFISENVQPKAQPVGMKESNAQKIAFKLGNAMHRMDTKVTTRASSQELTTLESPRTANSAMSGEGKPLAGDISESSTGDISESRTGDHCPPMGISDSRGERMDESDDVNEMEMDISDDSSSGNITLGEQTGQAAGGSEISLSNAPPLPIRDPAQSLFLANVPAIEITPVKNDIPPAMPIETVALSAGREFTGGVSPEDDATIDTNDEDSVPPPPPPATSIVVCNIDASDKYSPDSPTGDDDLEGMVGQPGEETAKVVVPASVDTGYAFGFERLLANKMPASSREPKDDQDFLQGRVEDVRPIPVVGDVAPALAVQPDKPLPDVPDIKPIPVVSHATEMQDQDYERTPTLEDKEDLVTSGVAARGIAAREENVRGMDIPVVTGVGDASEVIESGDHFEVKQRKTQQDDLVVLVSGDEATPTKGSPPSTIEGENKVIETDPVAEVDPPVLCEGFVGNLVDLGPTSDVPEEEVASPKVVPSTEELGNRNVEGDFSSVDGAKGSETGGDGVCEENSISDEQSLPLAGTSLNQGKVVEGDDKTTPNVAKVPELSKAEDEVPGIVKEDCQPGLENQSSGLPDKTLEVGFEPLEPVPALSATEPTVERDTPPDLLKESDSDMEVDGEDRESPQSVPVLEKIGDLSRAGDNMEVEGGQEEPKEDAIEGPPEITGQVAENHEGEQGKCVQDKSGMSAEKDAVQEMKVELEPGQVSSDAKETTDGTGESSRDVDKKETKEDPSTGEAPSVEKAETRPDSSGKKDPGTAEPPDPSLNLEPGEILEKEAESSDSRGEGRGDREERRQRDRDRRSDRRSERELERKARLKEWGIVDKENFPPFEKLTENFYITERKKSKAVKEARRMVCDCATSREDRNRGIIACGENCLNRLLMIECTSRCPCGDYCTNDKFQRRDYADVGVFYAESKGHGMKTLQDMKPNQFIMEYCGEVLTSSEFRSRSRQYKKEGQHHFYFMALKTDEIIDATKKGNLSRFINHSCDPNCETQKWTVNGQLRVGFFTKTHIKAGTELTFDYQFEQYGEELQKCYCGTSKCRTYIGKPKKFRDQSTPRRRSSLDKRRRELTDVSLDPGAASPPGSPQSRVVNLLDEDIESMVSDLDNEGLKKSEQTIKLARYMVRAETLGQRLQLLKILQETTESTYLKLFLSHHGLTLIWSWMVDLGENPQELKMDILKTLAKLPVSTKNAVEDSKVLAVVERWAKEESTKADSESSSAGGTPPVHKPGTASPTSKPGTASPTRKSGTASPTVEEGNSSSESDVDRTAPKKQPELRQMVLEATLSSAGAPDTKGEGDAATEEEAAAAASLDEDGDGGAETDRGQEVADQESGSGQDESTMKEAAGPDVPKVDGEEAKTAEGDGKGSEVNAPEGVEEAVDPEAMDGNPPQNHVWDMAASLLESWSSLKEVYKIPKKESERDRDRDRYRERDRDRDRDRDRHRDSRDSRDRYRDRGGRDRDRDRDRDRRDDRRRDSSSSSSSSSRRDSDRSRDSRDYRRRKRSHSRSPERASSSSSGKTTTAATSAKVKKTDSVEARNDQKGVQDTSPEKKISKEERRARFAKKVEEEEREREVKRQQEAELRARQVAEAAQYMAETGLVPAILDGNGVPMLHPGVMVDPNNPGMVIDPNNPTILLPIPPDLHPHPQGVNHSGLPMQGNPAMGGEGMPSMQGMHHQQGMVPPEHFHHPDMQLPPHHHPEDMHHHHPQFTEGMPPHDHPQHMGGGMLQHPGQLHQGQQFMMDQNFRQEVPHGQFMPDPNMDQNFVQHMQLEQHHQQQHFQQQQADPVHQEFAPAEFEQRPVAHLTQPDFEQRPVAHPAQPEFDQRPAAHPGDFMAVPSSVPEVQVSLQEHHALQQQQLSILQTQAAVRPTLHQQTPVHPVVSEEASYHPGGQEPSTTVSSSMAPQMAPHQQQQQFAPPVAGLHQATHTLAAPSTEGGLMPPPPAPPRKGKKKRVTFDPDIPDNEPSIMQGDTGHPQVQSKFASVPPQVTSTFTPHTPPVVVQQPPHGILVKPSVTQPAATPGVVPGPVVQAPGQPVVLPVSQSLPQPAAQAAETTVTFMTPDGMLVTQTIRPISSKDAIASGNLAHMPHATQAAAAPPVEDVPAPPPVKVKPKRTGLPPHWKTAKDSEGKTYYYHSKTRQTQWDPPTWDDTSEKDPPDTMDLGTPTYDEKTKRKTTTAAADTSSEDAKKLKDYFRSKMSHNVVTYLNAYRKPDCKKGRIQTTEDFKHLARKLTHHILSKELKNCLSIEDLEVNENVKYKAREYIRKYMSKFGSVYKKDTLDL